MQSKQMFPIRIEPDTAPGSNLTNCNAIRPARVDRMGSFRIFVLATPISGFLLSEYTTFNTLDSQRKRRLPNALTEPDDRGSETRPPLASPKSVCDDRPV